MHTYIWYKSKWWWRPVLSALLSPYCFSFCTWWCLCVQKVIYKWKDWEFFFFLILFWILFIHVQLPHVWVYFHGGDFLRMLDGFLWKINEVLCQKNWPKYFDKHWTLIIVITAFTSSSVRSIKLWETFANIPGACINFMDLNWK